MNKLITNIGYKNEIENKNFVSNDIQILNTGKTAAIMTLGCKVNKYESEAVEELLIKNGYKMVSFEEYADIYIINTCTVTAMSAKKSRQMIRRTKKLNADAVVAVIGCYSQKNPQEVLEIEEVNIVLGTSKRALLISELEKVGSKDKKVVVDDIMKIRDFEEMNISHVSDRTRALIKIQDGCDRYCSYCIIPYTRGPVRSRKLQNIIKEVQTLAENGYKEVVLTGIHVASYGKDVGGTLADVISEVGKVEGVERVRISSVEPIIITEEFLDRVSKVKSFCEHFHLSMQSGSDTVLKRMNRRYTATEYKNAVDLIRKYYSYPAITTDVIVGFPEETEEEFLETKELLEKMKLYETHIFKYSIREGTKAALMKDHVSDFDKQKRSETLISLSNRNKRDYHDDVVGKELDVLFETCDEKFCYGHTKNYIKVAVKNSEYDIINKIKKVKVEQAEQEYVIGSL